MQFYENKLRKCFVISRHYGAFITPYFSTAKIILQSSQSQKAFLLRYEVQYRLLQKLREFDIPFLYPYQLFTHHFTTRTAIKFLLDKGRLPLASARKRSYATPSSGLKRRPQRPLEQFLKTVCPAFHNSPVLNQ